MKRWLAAYERERKKEVESRGERKKEETLCFDAKSVKMFHFCENFVQSRPEVTLKTVLNVPTRASRGPKRFSLRLQRDSCLLGREFREFDASSFPNDDIPSPRVHFRPEVLATELDRDLNRSPHRVSRAFKTLSSCYLAFSKVRSSTCICRRNLEQFTRADFLILYVLS